MVEIMSVPDWEKCIDGANITRSQIVDGLALDGKSQKNSQIENEYKELCQYSIEIRQKVVSVSQDLDRSLRTKNDISLRVEKSKERLEGAQRKLDAVDLKVRKIQAQISNTEADKSELSLKIRALESKAARIPRIRDDLLDPKLAKFATYVPTKESEKFRRLEDGISSKEDAILRLQIKLSRYSAEKLQIEQDVWKRKSELKQVEIEQRESIVNTELLQSFLKKLEGEFLHFQERLSSSVLLPRPLKLILIEKTVRELRKTISEHNLDSKSGDMILGVAEKLAQESQSFELDADDGLSSAFRLLKVVWILGNKESVDSIVRAVDEASANSTSRLLDVQNAKSELEALMAQGVENPVDSMKREGVGLFGRLSRRVFSAKVRNEYRVFRNWSNCVNQARRQVDLIQKEVDKIDEEICSYATKLRCLGYPEVESSIELYSHYLQEQKRFLLGQYPYLELVVQNFRINT